MKLPLKNSALVVMAAVFSSLSLTSNAEAAIIAWSGPTTISGDSDVQNSGSLIGAFSIGSTGVPSSTVNGVTFASLGFADNSNTVTSGNFSLNMNGALASNTGFGTTVAPFSNLSTSYKSLLQSGSFAQNGPITLRMNGLTVGRDYSFQTWVNNAGNFTDNSSQIVRVTSGNSVDLRTNTGTPANNPPIGGLGQFATGTFRADSTTQVITFTSPNDFPVLNAFQLRAVPTPEPSTYAMMALGLLALGLVSYKRNPRRGQSGLN